MKVKFSITNGCEIEQDVPGVKQAFALVAHLQDLFGVKKCGNCSSPNVRLSHKTPQGYEYFSVKCEDCYHELKFGQARDTGKLFPKGWEPGFKKQQDEEKPRRQRRPEPVYQYGPEGYDDDDRLPNGPSMAREEAADDGVPW